LRRVGVLERLFAAGAELVEHPAVVAAAQAALLDDAVAKIGAAVRTVPFQQTVVSGKILVQHKVFAKQSHRLGRRVIQFRNRRDRLPVAAQQRAHLRAGPDLGQQTVAFVAQHQASFTSFCMQRISSSGLIGVPRLRIAVRATSPT
jgi:hypothetical protein